MSNHNFKNTVFVIGAGAHVPYGMPTTKTLTDEIRCLCASRDIKPKENSVTKDREMTQEKLSILVHELLYSERSYNTGPLVFDGKKISLEASSKIIEDIKKITDDFGISGSYSIDSYLSNKIDSFKSNSEEDKKSLEELLTIGKLLITYFIMEYEKNTSIAYREHDWIEYIINAFLQDKEDMEAFFSKNGPHFFTFNYDNLFEKILLGRLTKWYDLSCEDAISKIQNMNLFHVYGDINSLENEPLSNNDIKKLEFYKNAINRIRVIGEDRDDKHVKEISKKFLQQVQSEYSDVYFLGFGFDKKNIEALVGPPRVETWVPTAAFYSTNKNISRNHFRNILKDFPGYLEFPTLKSDIEHTENYTIEKEFESQNTLSSIGVNTPGEERILFRMEPEYFIKNPPSEETSCLSLIRDIEVIFN